MWHPPTPGLLGRFLLNVCSARHALIAACARLSLPMWLQTMGLKNPLAAAAQRANGPTDSPSSPLPSSIRNFERPRSATVGSSWREDGEEAATSMAEGFSVSELPAHWQSLITAGESAAIARGPRHRTIQSPPIYMVLLLTPQRLAARCIYQQTILCFNIWAHVPFPTPQPRIQLLNTVLCCHLPSPFPPRCVVTYMQVPSLCRRMSGAACFATARSPRPQKVARARLACFRAP